MSLRPESVFVCEGYHDRAFLRSWLLRLGWESYTVTGYQGGTKKISGGGQYAFKSAAGAWLRIVPIGGDSKLYGDERRPRPSVDEREKTANTLIAARQTSPIATIVIVTDDDAFATSSSLTVGEGTNASRGLENEQSSTAGQTKRRAQFEAWARRHGASPVGAQGDFELSGGICSTRLSLVVWRTAEPSSPFLPPQQSLERLVCAAVHEVYPERCESIRAWLSGRPEPPVGEKFHKTHAAAHMAGWFSDRGYEGFFDAVWEDERLRIALLERMRVVGADRLAAVVLGDPATVSPVP